jgi:hypothetical protein
MRKALIIAALVSGLGAAGSAAHAQGYLVNGHAASPAEVQQLASYGAQPGSWVVDGYGISAAEHGQSKPVTPAASGQKCWYVLDVQLCE